MIASGGTDGGRATIPPRTWREIAPAVLAEVHDLLCRAGARDDPEVRGEGEAWRVRLDRTVVTAYRRGTIYCSGGTAPELGFLYEKIEECRTRRVRS